RAGCRGRCRRGHVRCRSLVTPRGEDFLDLQSQTRIAAGIFVAAQVSRRRQQDDALGLDNANSAETAISTAVLSERWAERRLSQIVMLLLGQHPHALAAHGVLRSNSSKLSSAPMK